MNNEDITVASLAKLVGSELARVDALTQSTGQQGPANKTNPHSFLLNNNLNLRKKAAAKGIVYHQGKAFYAGPDETLVQQMYPEAGPALSAKNSSSASTQANLSVDKSLLPAESVESISTLPKQLTSSTLSEDAVSTTIKLLKSIDKSLKTIAKTLTQNKE